jgi:hypothetical protein
LTGICYEEYGIKLSKLGHVLFYEGSQIQRRWANTWEIPETGDSVIVNCGFVRAYEYNTVGLS